MGGEEDPASREPENIDALIDDFGDRAGPDPAREPEVEPVDPESDEEDATQL